MVGLRPAHWTLPPLTAAIPAVRAEVRATPDDFRVEEVPLYDPCGEGTHTYFAIEKRGISTHEAVRRLAERLGRSQNDFGYAGLKDAHAVAVQVLSLEHMTERERARIAELADGASGTSAERPIRPLWFIRHKNKLRIGHLRGNRFRLRLGAVSVEDEGSLRAALDQLLRHGLPNYFGEQRFGVRGTTGALGRALLLGEDDAFLRLLLGDGGGATPGALSAPEESPESARVREARALYEAGDLAGALARFPHYLPAERAALRQLGRQPSRPDRAIAAIPRRLRQLYVSAYQSALFNRLLAERVSEGMTGAIEPGDVAYIHANGAAFVVGAAIEDAAREQPRSDRFEISPAGPIFGTKLLKAMGRPGEREEALLAAEGLELESWRRPFEERGARRPYRIPLADLEATREGADVRLSFFLPPGAYATAVLAEILKPAASGSPGGGGSGGGGGGGRSR